MSGQNIPKACADSKSQKKNTKIASMGPYGWECCERRSVVWVGDECDPFNSWDSGDWRVGKVGVL